MGDIVMAKSVADHIIKSRSHSDNATEPTRAELRAIVIGIPARDEEDLIHRSVTSVLDSASFLDPMISVRVVVACDTCTDATQQIVAAIAADDCRVSVISGRWASAGASRGAAIDFGLNATGTRDSDMRSAWIASTDADTVVGRDWLSQHVAAWSDGDHAVAGIVEILDDAHHTPRVAAAFRNAYVLGSESHHHVHGANLGVRADAYRSVGGFQAIRLAEDHALWNQLMQSGYVCRPSLSLRVATSGRTHGRAVGGFADTLHANVERYNEVSA